MTSDIARPVEAPVESLDVAAATIPTDAPESDGTLASTVTGRDAMDAPGTWMGMERAVRNNGRVGIAAMAFDGVLSPRDSARRPDLPRPGLGLELRRSKLERCAAG